MGSPLGPVLANIFMCHFEEKWLMKSRFCPSLWFRYADDTFTMFESKNNANEFLSFLNSRHDSIKFTIEFEEDNKISFPGGGVLYISLGGEVRQGPSYPDPV